MAKVTVHPSDAESVMTPSQQVIADANGIVRVKDALGRTIGVRKMSMSVRRRTLKAILPQSTENGRYVALVMMAACVVDIDGEIVDPLRGGGNEIVLDALIDRLDDDGFAAIGEAMLVLNPPRDEEGAELKNS